jgi:nitrous oxidase accessory protein NosD
MDSRTRRKSLSLVSTLLAIAAVVAAFCTPAALAGPRTCVAQNAGTTTEYGDLAAAIAAASAGDTINVSGTCHGNFQIDKNLTFQGQGSNPTLDGDYAFRVLTITTGTTTIHDLKIQHGQMTGRFPENAGGGIYVGSAAVLDNVVVSENSVDPNNFGGGIEADLGSMLTLTDSTVKENVAGSSGGIDMFRAKASLIRSVVTDNTAKQASIDGCAFGDNVYSCAGGVWNYQGTLALTDSAITGNRGGYRGGGIRNDVRLSGGGIWTNAATGLDANGGIRAADGTATYLDPVSNTTLPAWTGSVFGNHPDQCSPAIVIGTVSCS